MTVYFEYAVLIQFVSYPRFSIGQLVTDNSLPYNCNSCILDLVSGNLLLITHCHIIVILTAQLDLVSGNLLLITHCHIIVILVSQI